MINRDNYLMVKRYLEYLEQVKQNESNTLKRRRIQFRHLLEWADEAPFCDAPEIRPAFPRYLLVNRNDNQPGSLAASTVTRTLRAVREFFIWLKLSSPSQYRKLTDTWFATLRAPKAKQAEVVEHEQFSLDEVRKLVGLKAETLTDMRDQAAIAFLFVSGARVGAFVTLSLGCIDLSTGAVKQWPKMGVRTKNGKAATTRLLEIPDLMTVIRRWDDYVRAHLPDNALWFASLSSDGASLTGATVAGVERRAMVAKAIKRLCQRAGLGYHSPHKLRHGHAVYAFKQARTIEQLKAVSQNLMHSSLTITDSIYGVLSGQDVAEVIAGLGHEKMGGDVIKQLEVILAQLKNQ
jgi:site-specific recombinase XerC